MKIKKSLLIYCFKADSYESYLRRVELVAKWILHRYNNQLISAMFKRNTVVFNDLIKRSWLK